MLREYRRATPIVKSYFDAAADAPLGAPPLKLRITQSSGCSTKRTAKPAERMVSLFLLSFADAKVTSSCRTAVGLSTR